MADLGNKKGSYSLISVEKGAPMCPKDPSDLGANADHASSALREACGDAAANGLLSDDNPGLYRKGVFEQDHLQEELFSQDSCLDKNVSNHTGESIEDDYDDLSLDDLNGSVPMDRMRKALIVILILALAAFAVYFLFFM